MTRTKSTFLALLAVLLSPMAANADPIFYDVNRTIGDGTVIGTIVTDGTLGGLTSANFLEWVLTITAPNLDGGTPQILSELNSSFQWTGNLISATTAQLSFDFSQIGGFFFGGGSGPGWCGVGGSQTCYLESGPAEQIFSSEGILLQSSAREGEVVIATRVPEPGTLALLGLGLLGMGAARRRKKA